MFVKHQCRYSVFHGHCDIIRTQALKKSLTLSIDRRLQTDETLINLVWLKLLIQNLVLLSLVPRRSSPLTGNPACVAAGELQVIR